MSTPDNQSLLQEVAARAATDLAFRGRLLTSPADAIYQAFGVRVPNGHRIRFIEKPADVDTLIVLPDVHAPAELDEEALELAAGGDGDPPPPPPVW